ncbi:ATP-binding protein [Dyella sp. 2RAB6]|uniref:ATP-binding protein n=1 Tax=Dyella sp. 2RAB6 TaxID=3232992 RepID=UPI003F8E810B
MGYRLFLAIWLTILVAGALGVELVRWRLLDNFAEHRLDTDTHFLDTLGATLEASYRQHGDWSFLPHDAAQRKAWLREAYERSRGTAGPLDARSGASSVAYRIGLANPQGRYLAGAVASPLMIAFASIDRAARPLTVDGRPVGTLIVAYPQNPDDALAVAFLIDQQAHLAWALVAALLLSMGVASLLAAYIRRPIMRLVAGARQLESGRFDTRIDSPRTDELGELAQAFDRLAARLEEVERMRQQWIAETSHELRTPLAVLRAQIESFQDGVRTATPANIALMERQIRSLSQLVDDLHELARGDLGQVRYELAPLDAWQLATEVFADFSARFDANGLLATIGEAPLRRVAHGDASRIRQVLANLLENSARYTKAGGSVALAGDVVDDTIHIRIDDSAPGVPAASLDRLGERFFRLDDSRNRASGGSGLGLALCRQILAAHGGRLMLAPSPLGGLRATMVLPLDDR